MIRRFSATTVVAIAILLLAMSAHAQQGPLETKVGILYNSKNAAGNLMPQFSEDPGTGLRAAVRYPIGLAAFGGGLTTTTTRMWSSQGDMDMGHTGVFLSAERHLNKMHLSAQHTYMLSKEDSDHNEHETLLKAELHASDAQKPYVLIGLITPAQHAPDPETKGLGGVGLATSTPIAMLHPSAAIVTDSFLATTLLNIGKKESTFKSSMALELEPQDGILLKLGFNLFQDIARKEYCTWWSASASYRF